MKTKVVYSVISCDKDYFIDQTWVSVFSLRQRNPDVEVILLTDEFTYKTLSGNRRGIMDFFNDIVVVPIPKEYTNTQKSRFLKTSIRNIVRGDYLFIDSDTVICDDLSEVDSILESEDFNIGAVLDRHVLVSENFCSAYLVDMAYKCGWNMKSDNRYFNSGVMLVKDNESTRLFYRLWHEQWLLCKEKGIVFDQIPLGIANSKMGYPIIELNGIWNCQIQANAVQYLSEAKIIHYFTNTSTQRPYWFANNNAFDFLHKTGYFDNEMLNHISYPKAAFLHKNILVAGLEYELQNTNSHELMIMYPHLFRRLDILVGWGLRIIKRFKRR